MTGPEDPGAGGADGADWGFPEVDPAGPSSTALPEPEQPEEQIIYDTGSDAWWRAQAEAQRQAAASEPALLPTPPVAAAPPSPPPTVEPEVLLPEPAAPALEEPAAFDPEPAHEPDAFEPAPVALEPEAPSFEPEPVAVEPPPAPITSSLPIVAPSASDVAPRTSEPSPLDDAWVPPDFPELRAPAAPTDEPAYEVGTDHHHDDHDHDHDHDEAYDVPSVEVEHEPEWYAGDAPTAETVAAPMPLEVPEADDSAPLLRPAYAEGQKVSAGRALAGALLALAGVALGIGALFYLNHKDPDAGGAAVANPPASTQPSTPASTQPSTAPTTAVTTPPPVVTTAPPAAPAPVVPVSVLNNSKTKGLAATAKARFKAGGWPVPTTGNYRGIVQQTTIYYPAGQQASAERFAKQFGIPRVLPRSSLPGLPVQGMTVVLTRDYRT